MQGAAQRVLVFGATGTIGGATVAALLAQGHEVAAFMRARPGREPKLPAGAQVVFGDVADADSLVRDAFAGARFDAVVSCLASRTGVPQDAWAVDHRANLNLLQAARAAGVERFVLLSAICVQKPTLAFQQAKLAFERELVASGLQWSIVRPTAFFKSLCGQVERVRAGKPFLVFGDGRLTACKPISDGDLGDYIARCLVDDDKRNRVLPIGGPGPAITPREQGERLFALLGREPKFKSVPVAMLDAVAGVLGTLGRVLPPLAAKAELARIGRYYATESMLVWDNECGRYDAEATPETGTHTLFDFYAEVVAGRATLPERGEHKVF